MESKALVLIPSAAVVITLVGIFFSYPAPADVPAADVKHEVLRSQDGERLRRWTDYEMGVVCYQTANSALACIALKEFDN
jgi:hypothetical protein